MENRFNFSEIEKVYELGKIINKVHKVYGIYKDANDEVYACNAFVNYTKWEAAYDASRKAESEFRAAVREFCKYLGVEPKGKSSHKKLNGREGAYDWKLCFNGYLMGYYPFCFDNYETKNLVEKVIKMSGYSCYLPD